MLVINCRCFYKWLPNAPTSLAKMQIVIWNEIDRSNLCIQLSFHAWFSISHTGNFPWGKSYLYVTLLGACNKDSCQHASYRTQVVTVSVLYCKLLTGYSIFGANYVLPDFQHFKIVFWIPHCNSCLSKTGNYIWGPRSTCPVIISHSLYFIPISRRKFMPSLEKKTSRIGVMILAPHEIRYFPALWSQGMQVPVCIDDGHYWQPYNIQVFNQVLMFSDWGDCPLTIGNDFFHKNTQTVPAQTEVIHKPRITRLLGKYETRWDDKTVEMMRSSTTANLTTIYWHRIQLCSSRNLIYPTITKLLSYRNIETPFIFAWISQFSKPASLWL